MIIHGVLFKEEEHLGEVLTEKEGSVVDGELVQPASLTDSTRTPRSVGRSEVANFIVGMMSISTKFLSVSWSKRVRSTMPTSMTRECAAL